MPFSENFSESQSLSDLNDATFTDTSTGSDPSIASRDITLTKADNTTLAANEPWALADTSITLDVMNRDYDLQVRVRWLDAGGAVLYSKTQPIIFTGYIQTFLYNKVSQQAASYPNIIQDTNYFNSLSLLQTLYDGAVQANDLASDIYTGQSLLDMGYNIMQKETYYF